MLLLLQSVLHKKYFSAFCASCYCARRVLISSQRRHQTLQTDAASDEMHLCAMHFLQPPPRRVLFPTRSLQMEWNYFAAAPQIKGKRLSVLFMAGFVAWPSTQSLLRVTCCKLLRQRDSQSALILGFLHREFYIRKQWTAIIYVWQVQQLFSVLDRLLTCNLG